MTTKKRQTASSAATLNVAKKRTLAATVSLADRAAQGVLVPGGFVSTAAHCVEWSTTGGMVLGDHCLENVRTKTGEGFRLSVYAVEPVADIAILGPPDYQEFSDDADAFEAFCEATSPVPVSAADFPFKVPVRVLLLTHHGTWIEGTATRYGLRDALPGACLALKTEADIEGGSSGGPIIDRAGQLVGITSHGTRTGGMPSPHLALPGWIWRRIDAAQRPRKRARGRP